MTRACVFVLAWLGLFLTVNVVSPVHADEWIDLFDGKTLENWDGDPDLWSVEDGVITGRTTPDTNLKSNSFLIYRGQQFDNFELKFEYRIVDGTVEVTAASVVHVLMEMVGPELRRLVAATQE